MCIVLVTRVLILIFGFRLSRQPTQKMCAVGDFRGDSLPFAIGILVYPQDRASTMHTGEQRQNVRAASLTDKPILDG